jgi:hypothetical protein
MKKTCAVWIVAATLSFAASAKDAFDAVECGGDVAKSLTGGKIPNGPAAELEKRHAALHLKLEDSDMLDEPLNYEAWTICGDTYHVILRKDVVTDAVKADHSKAAPSFLGPCERNGKLMSDTVLAILKPTDGDAAKLPATAAWRIDGKSGKFVAMDAAELMCSRDGIATIDGGR